MATIFTKIIQGEIPSYKVAENDKFYAFLDINPLQEGHTLVVPKLEIDYLFDVDDELYIEMWLFAKKLGLAIESVIPCKRIGLIVLGLEVPHAHIHIVPMKQESDLLFNKPRLQLSNEEFVEIANKISLAFQEINQ